jgi:hypothetical protein
MEKAPEKITIQRDNMKDLVFEGWELAESSNRKFEGPGQNRYTTLTLYKSRAGKYVLLDEYKTHWQGEDDRTDAAVYDTIEDLLADLIGDDGAVSEMRKELIKGAAAEDENFQGVLIERID